MGGGSFVPIIGTILGQLAREGILGGGGGGGDSPGPSEAAQRAEQEAEEERQRQAEARRQKTEQAREAKLLEESRQKTRLGQVATAAAATGSSLLGAGQVGLARLKNKLGE